MGEKKKNYSALLGLTRFPRVTRAFQKIAFRSRGVRLLGLTRPYPPGAYPALLAGGFRPFFFVLLGKTEKIRKTKLENKKTTSSPLPAKKKTSTPPYPRLFLTGDSRKGIAGERLRGSFASKLSRKRSTAICKGSCRVTFSGKL